MIELGDPTIAPEHSSRIERLLDDALEHDPAEWPVWIEHACAGDGALRAELESLLGRYTDACGFLHTPAPDLAARLVAEARGAGSPQPLEGKRVGPYRVLELLGCGGMGHVYLAERADGEFQQRVAIKLLRPGVEGEEPDRRFRIERQILAGLEHPHITRMLDGGLTDDGRPFFVMEYIDGTRSTVIARNADSASRSGSRCSSTSATPCSTPTATWSCIATSSRPTS